MTCIASQPITGCLWNKKKLLSVIKSDLPWFSSLGATIYHEQKRCQIICGIKKGFQLAQLLHSRTEPLEISPLIMTLLGQDWIVNGPKTVHTSTDFCKVALWETNIRSTGLKWLLHILHLNKFKASLFSLMVSQQKKSYNLNFFQMRFKISKNCIKKKLSVFMDAFLLIQLQSPLLNPLDLSW